ncbi:hypothetical protein GMJAKD_12815 [Candidatus Electrothrix aarhusensis]
MDAEPVLGCRFVDKSRQPYWERKKDLDREGRVDIAEVNDAMQAALEYMVKPIDPCDGPQVQARLFRAKRDTLCLKINHMVADAGGVKEYIYLLSSIYRQLEKDPSYIPEVNSAGSRSRMQVVQHFIFWDKVKIVRRSFRDWKEAYFPVGNWSVPLQHLTQSQKTYVIRKIELQQFRVVRQYCKKYGVTVNDIMMAAYVRSLYKMLQPSPEIPLRLSTTVDLRQHFLGGKGEAICNLSGKFAINIGMKPGSNLAEAILIVHSKMKERKNDCFGLGDCHHFIFNLSFLPFPWTCKLAGLWDNFMQRISPRPPPPVFTNLGKLDNAQVSFGEVTIQHAFLTALATCPPLFLMSLSGFQETLTMSIGFCEDAIHKEKIERFLKDISWEINSLPCHP